MLVYHHDSTHLFAPEDFDIAFEDFGADLEDSSAWRFRMSLPCWSINRPAAFALLVIFLIKGFPPQCFLLVYIHVHLYLSSVRRTNWLFVNDIRFHYHLLHGFSSNIIAFIRPHTSGENENYKTMIPFYFFLLLIILSNNQEKNKTLVFFL